MSHSKNAQRRRRGVVMIDKTSKDTLKRKDVGDGQRAEIVCEEERYLARGITGVQGMSISLMYRVPRSVRLKSGASSRQDHNVFVSI